MAGERNIGAAAPDAPATNLHRAAIEQLGLEDAFGIPVVEAALKLEPAVRGGQVLDLRGEAQPRFAGSEVGGDDVDAIGFEGERRGDGRSEEHTSELQSL